MEEKSNRGRPQQLDNPFRVTLHLELDVVKKLDEISSFQNNRSDHIRRAIDTYLKDFKKDGKTD